MKNDTNKNEDKKEELEEVKDGQQDQLQEKLDEAENKYRRALADYQNLEKRVIEDRREWIRSANKDLLLRLLPVLDTLVLASKHDENKNLAVSIGQFLDVLKSEGVTKIETIGKKFDPEIMECVSIVEGEDGKVIEEARSGFMLNDRLLRPAQVIVGEKK
jgi:molecular chaperone GrpE